jgi:phosphatidylinositol dimannoside acyltransferase
VSLDFLKWKAIDVLARLLPRRAGYALAGGFSRLMWATDAAGRKAVMANLGHILRARGGRPGEAELVRLGRETYRNFGRYLIEFFKIEKMTPEELAAAVTVENPSYVSEASPPGRGLIPVTAHMCNWEIAAMAVVSLGRPMYGVYFPMKDPRTAALFERRRRGRGLLPIPFGRAAAVVLRLLKNGEAVGLVTDADFSPADELLDFFGSPARLPSAPARMAMKTDSLLLPAFTRRRPDGTFVVRFHPPIDPRVEGSVEAIRAKLRAVLEEEVGESPTEWFVFVDFWDREANRSLATEGVG